MAESSDFSSNFRIHFQSGEILFLRGKPSPRLPSQVASQMPLQAVSFSPLCCLVRYPFCGGIPRNAPTQRVALLNEFCAHFVLPKLAIILPLYAGLCPATEFSSKTRLCPQHDLGLHPKTLRSTKRAIFYPLYASLAAYVAARCAA